ncbi:MAG TPA: hypothetical protein PLU69_10235 [Acinetobacter sp.]|nr:hypothetical protein [Thermoflexales bacterium]HQW54312.1 hypothetical protein [Acinetobacter sp.]
MLFKDLKKLSETPIFGTDKYFDWVNQEDFINFLRNLQNHQEMVLYASLDFALIFSIASPIRLINSNTLKDLRNWSCSPYEMWGVSSYKGKSFLDRPYESSESKILKASEPLIFIRNFKDRQGSEYYVEINQKLTQVFNLHFLQERNSYCRYDANGDIEEVIRVFDIEKKLSFAPGIVVTINRQVLDEYLLLTKQANVLLFDSTRFCYDNFSGWAGIVPEEFSIDQENWFHLGKISNHASYLHGYQIGRSKVRQRDLFKSEKKYESFITHDWKHQQVLHCSCDPSKLGNYFEDSDLPFEISPVFFRPEVLLKYKAASEKYTVEYRSITCRETWHLQLYDVNEAGQVFTYLKYLGQLPYAEQLYWKSFNEAPKAPISQRAIDHDFEGKWIQHYDPLNDLLKILKDLHKAQVSWWKLADLSLLSRVHYPLTASADEWGREIHSLDKLVVEGFVLNSLRSILGSLGGSFETKWQSLKLIQEILEKLGLSELETNQIVSPLIDLHKLRNKIIGHATGKEAIDIKTGILNKHHSFWEHFKFLSSECCNSVHEISKHLEQY